MAIISMINLKGGVGKSTMTVAFAEFLAGHFKRRVLVIDLDPQTNSTIALIGDKRWQALNEQQRTLNHVFLTPFASPAHPFGLGDIITTEASFVSEARPRIDLLASSTDLIGQESVVEAISTVTHYEMESHAVLKAAFDEDPALRSRYDDVLIDCPPSLNIVTLNGLYVSDAYLIPVMPEPISMIGIPQIINRVYHLQRRFGRIIPALGILVNRFDNRAQKSQGEQEEILERRVTQSLANPNQHLRWPPLFSRHVLERVLITQALQEGLDIGTLRGKYNDHSPTNPTFYDWIAIVEEYIERCATLTTSHAS